MLGICMLNLRVNVLCVWVLVYESMCFVCVYVYSYLVYM